MLNASGLEAAIAERNLKKETFALLCGISPSRLSNYLAGRNGVDEETRDRMMKALPGVPWKQLFFLEPEFATATMIAQAS